MRPRDKDYLHNALEFFNKRGIVKGINGHQSFSVDRFNKSIISHDLRFDKEIGIDVPDFELPELIKANGRIDCKVLCYSPPRMSDEFVLLRARSSHLKNENGEYYFLSYASHNGSFWEVAEVKCSIHDDSYNNLYADVFKDMNTVSLNSYYEWHCIIKEDENSRAIKFWCEPETLKHVFKMREKRQGRRKAIVNIIHEYQRRQKTSEGERDRLIREHFRGNSAFVYDGMEISVVPSHYDMNRIKTEKQFELHAI